MTMLLDRPTAAQPAPETAGEADTGGIVFVVLSGDFERIFAALTLATSAAASGLRATLFFTFWGLFSLVKNDRGITGENWMQKMMSVMNRGGTEHLKLSKMNFAGMGMSMMQTLAKQHGMATPQQLLEIARDLGVRLVPCQMTMDVLGLTRSDLVDGVEEPVGAATVIELMQRDRALFI